MAAPVLVSTYSPSRRDTKVRILSFDQTHAHAPDASAVNRSPFRRQETGVVEGCGWISDLKGVPPRGSLDEQAGWLG